MDGRKEWRKRWQLLDTPKKNIIHISSVIAHCVEIRVLFIRFVFCSFARLIRLSLSYMYNLCAYLTTECDKRHQKASENESICNVCMLCMESRAPSERTRIQKILSRIKSKLIDTKNCGSRRAGIQRFVAELQQQQHQHCQQQIRLHDAECRHFSRRSRWISINTHKHTAQFCSVDITFTVLFRRFFPRLTFTYKQLELTKNATPFYVTHSFDIYCNRKKELKICCETHCKHQMHNRL